MKPSHEKGLQRLAVVGAVLAAGAYLGDCGPFADPTKEEIAETARVTEEAAHMTRVGAIKTTEETRVNALTKDVRQELRELGVQGVPEEPVIPPKGTVQPTE